MKAFVCTWRSMTFPIKRIPSTRSLVASKFNPNLTLLFENSLKVCNHMLEYCADNGAHIGLDAKGKFVMLLKQHGVTFDDILEFKLNGAGPKGMIPIAPKPKIKGKSKLKKWTCGCQIVRVGKREFSATCDICNNRFKGPGKK